MPKRFCWAAPRCKKTSAVRAAIRKIFLMLVWLVGENFDDDGGASS
jgi:hypothetical protein